MKTCEQTLTKPTFTAEDLVITPFETANYLDNDEDITEYLTMSFADPDYDIFIIALSDVVKAKGAAQTAAKLGKTQEELLQILQPDNKPSFAIIQQILHALELHPYFSTEPAPTFV